MKKIGLISIVISIISIIICIYSNTIAYKNILMINYINDQKKEMEKNEKIENDINTLRKGDILSVHSHDIYDHFINSLKAESGQICLNERRYDIKEYPGKSYILSDKNATINVKSTADSILIIKRTR